MLFKLCFKENKELLPYRSHKGLNICWNFNLFKFWNLNMAEIRIFATSHRVSLEEGDQLNKNILICSTGYATSLNCILSSGEPFGSIRNSMDGIYPWAISLTPTTFCSLPWRFSFLFFFFFSWWHIVLPTSDIVIVPTDSFSITNIRQGETDFKTLIFHQYFT